MLPYMDRPADTKAGCKHRCTDAAMEYFKAEVMEMCHWENLYQIDLLHGSKNRVTEREYWAQRKGKAKLDRQAAAQAAALPAGEQPPKPTKFETDKEKLRQIIRAALSSATSYDEFSALLLRQGVTVKESRGRLSYLTPERTKPITARKLGDGFDRTAVLALLEQNAHRAAEKAAAIPEYTRTIRERLQQRELETGHPAPAAYGRYSNVFLSDTELSELQEELPGKWEFYIDRLSGYIASTGKQYRNHAATIRRWAADDTAKAAPKQGIPDYTYKEGQSL